jgi:NAD(P)-dependent dehydrogenase (short-subunit alcohol dehydrogenase family)
VGRDRQWRMQADQIGAARAYLDQISKQWWPAYDVRPLSGHARQTADLLHAQGALGLASQASAVHTAVRNCTRDEGGLSSILCRFIAPREIANLVVFLASDHASAITGAALCAAGGIIRGLA